MRKRPSTKCAGFATTAALKSPGWRKVQKVVRLACLTPTLRAAAEIPDSAGNGVLRWSAVGSMTREAMLLL